MSSDGDASNSYGGCSFIVKKLFDGVVGVSEIFDRFPGVFLIVVTFPVDKVLHTVRSSSTGSCPSASYLFYYVLLFSFYLYWRGRSRFLLIRKLRTFVKCKIGFVVDRSQSGPLVG